MQMTWRLVTLAVIGLSVALAGCGAHPRVRVPASTPSAPPLLAPATDEDNRLLGLVAESEQQVAEGRDHLERGRVAQARLAVRRTLDRLLASPPGTGLDPALDARVDRLIRQLAALQQDALAWDDVMVKRAVEPLAGADWPTGPTMDDPRAPPAVGGSENLEPEHSPEFSIPMNPEVLAALDLFRGRLRDFVTEGLSRGSRFLPMIRRVFREHGLPVELAAIPLVESAFRPSAASAHAKGLWQFTRETARAHGLRQDRHVDERADPEKATRAAARYLSALYERLGRDWLFALASYNSGPGRIQRAMERTGVTDYWSLAADASLPDETRRYVPMVLAAMAIARDPGRFGFAIPLLSLDDDPDRIGRSTTRPAAPIIYLVKPGDTLYGIARLFETSIAALQAWNNLRSSRLMPGDRLMVYPGGTLAAAQ